MTLTILKTFLFLLWLASIAFYAISAYCLASFYRKKGQPGTNTPPLTVLKPLKGKDENTYDNLRSFIAQDYPRFQVIFGVADENDPVIETVRRLMAEFPGVETELVISGREIGVNRKVSNLVNMHELSKHDIIVVADGDMRVGPGYLRAVAGGFSDPAVGMVTCPYRGAYPVDAGSALEALTIDTDFLPSVAVAERLEGLSFALGATMAARREALDAIGGFTALADYLADDYQFGNKIKKAGYKLLLSWYVVDSIQGRESIRGYFSHQLRWGRTYRACRPKGYFLSVLTKGTAFSVMFLLASGFDGLGWTVFGAGLAIRYVQAAYLEAAYIKGPGVLRYLWLLPLKDMLSFVIWALSFTGSTVKWKGASFRIDREGRMTR